MPGFARFAYCSEVPVTKIRVFLVGLMVAGSTLFVSASPAAAASCPYGKAGCAVYYTACQVLYDAGLLHCID
jgi:hypothetical protein